eukprot:m.100534 g.100534  ORF g.100534 m.100534 type:complete len:96 (-) comp12493_c0_seq1:6627-6914(-)
MRDDGEYKREGPHTEHIGCIASVAIGTAGCLWLASTVKGDLGLNWVDAAFDRILGLSNRARPSEPSAEHATLQSFLNAESLHGCVSWQARLAKSG